MVEPADLERLIGELELGVDRLRSLYEQYFMGIEKLEPTVPRKDVDRRIHVLRKEQIRNTALRFRFQMLLQRYNTYQTYWQRICREIENGTYKRHIARAQRRFGAGAEKRNSSLRPPAPAPAEAETIAAELERDFAPAARGKAPAADLLDLDVDLDEHLGAAQAPEAGAAAAAARAPSKGMWRKTAPAAPRFTPGAADAVTPASSSPAPPPPRPAAAARVPGPQATAATPHGPPSPAARAAPPGAPAAPRPPGPPKAPAPPPPPPQRQAPAVPAGGAPAPGPRSLPPRPGPPRPPPVPAPRAGAGAAAPPPAPPPARPAPPAPPLPRVARPGELSEDRVRQIYTQYVEAKRRSNESTAAITYESVARTLRDSSAKLREKHGKPVDFEVSVKDGKTVLKPVIK